MKKLFLILLFFAPVLGKAQADLLGKTRCDINIAFQNAKTPRVVNATFPVKGDFDTFDTGKLEQTICRYDDMEICTEVFRIMKTSFLAATLKDFDANYIKADGQLMLKNSWVDKAKTFKVHMENWIGVNRVYLNYLPFEKQFVKK